MDRQLRTYNKVVEKHSEDKGCLLADAVLGRKSICTECPFPNDCIVGRHGGLSASNKQERTEQITALRYAGASIPVIAETIGVSVRTVWKDLGGKR